CAGLAAGEGVLTPQELDLGVCVVDIGAGTTAVVVYNEGAARHLAVLPVGGNHVTSDIAIGLRTTLDEAERLKLNYGHTLPYVSGLGRPREVGDEAPLTRSRQRPPTGDVRFDLSKNSEVAARFFLENRSETSWSSPCPEHIRRRIT